MMEYKNLIVEVKDNVIFLTINRPERGNSLSNSLIEEFLDFFSKPMHRPEGRIVVITGSGQKCFCTGMDVNELGRKEICDLRESNSQLYRVFESIVNSEMVTVAAVNGIALGGGVGLAVSCDITLAARTAKFGLPEINLGLPPLIVLLPVIRLVGIKKAFWLSATGHFISAEEVGERV